MHSRDYEDDRQGRPVMEYPLVRSRLVIGVKRSTICSTLSYVLNFYGHEYDQMSSSLCSDRDVLFHRISRSGLSFARF